MDYLQQLQRRFRQSLLAIIALENVITIGLSWLLNVHTGLNEVTIAIISLISGFILSTVAVWIMTGLIIQPMRALWQAIVHLSPTEHGTAAPQPSQLRFGQELVTNLIAQVYQLASVAQTVSDAAHVESQDLSHNFIASSLPLPLLTLDASETITFANPAAAEYIGIAATDMIGKNIYMVLDMSFPSEDTFDRWLKEVKKGKATAHASWERVRLNIRDDHPTRMFDLAAYYNRDNAQHIETMVVLFDHTKTYSQDDQAVSFVALSVHELRTPLTLLRGYIEVFEEEFGDNLDPELRDFMLKMRASAQQLMAFVNNILNVARVDDDQLQLQLKEENWDQIIKDALQTLSLRAGVRGIKLEYSIQPGLPTVGVDRLSIFEVINNLVDNAIKYSGESKTIKLASYLTKDGAVETTIQDFGVGIPSAVMPNLFTKFYRDHRNRAQIGGTGLGLYLSKAIVTAHGGNLWVRSKEGEGSTFGFTLLPYSQVADELKNTDNKEIIRSAHGWIKNHSLYRR